MLLYLLSINSTNFVVASPSVVKNVVVVEKWIRHNGFERPFHPLQIISWIVFGYNLLIFYFVDMVSLSYNPILVVLLSILYLVLSIGVVYYCVKATKADPSDPTIKMQKDTEARGEVFDGKDYDFECEICDTAVLNTAKHCGACNRCTNGFDHHCHRYWGGP